MRDSDSAQKSRTDSRAKPPTINDVAEMAGVSVGTVSNVINHRSTVSSTRRERVLKAIETLGFSGSMLAKGMRAQSNPLVGLCVPHTTFANLAALADTLDERAVAADYELVQALSRYDEARELARIKRLIAYRVAGIIIVPALDPKPVLDHLHAAKLPTVIINRHVPEEKRFDQVTIDHQKSIYEASRQLYAWGHKRISLAIQYPTLSVTRQRSDALSKAAADAGGAASWNILEAGHDQERFIDIFAGHVRRRDAPSVIIASNSTIGRWVVMAMHQLGMRCPDDLSVMILEEPEWALLTEPQISAVEQPTREIGRIAWDRLMARIEGSREEPVVIRCEGKINFRSSVAGFTG
ncbi:DNA-binding LacI/PurR family transcriptional regulator [Hyphomicrobiales bacterium]|nr:DNA-binding LacI/PurR family transcriptional regulator [Hyphomicrobiales bacterium]CAH1690692.1 DNA-binding LacI/PurR family transcriptional regulator [Hyphomicrobiales bacterium]